MTSQLINVQEVFLRLNPHTVSRLLAPEVGSMAQDLAGDILPSRLRWLPESAASGLSSAQMEQLKQLNHRMLTRLTQDLQANIHSVLDVKELVVSEVSLISYMVPHSTSLSPTQCTTRLHTMYLCFKLHYTLA